MSLIDAGRSRGSGRGSAEVAWVAAVCLACVAVVVFAADARADLARTLRVHKYQCRH